MIWHHINRVRARLSWAWLCLAHGQAYEGAQHGLFTGGTFSSMLDMDRLLSRARLDTTYLLFDLTRFNLIYYVYTYDRCESHFQTIFEC
jgi:hypothetical protein